MLYHQFTIFASVLLVLLLPTVVLSLKCTVCEFKLLPPHSTNCTETCEGDVCFIVVNKYFNGTINAGCMNLHDGDTFDGEAVCQRTAHDNRCACNSGDKCNDPKVKLSSYTFTDMPVLDNYQWLPQIQPPMPSIQPVIPEEILPSSSSTPSGNLPHQTNDTTSDSDSDSPSIIGQELEAGIVRDVEKELENDDTNQTLLQNETQQNNENDSMTLKTTVGLNVRDSTNRQEAEKVQNATTTSTEKSPTSGLGSVEVSRLTSEFGPRTAATVRPIYQSPPEASNSTSTTNNTISHTNVTSDSAAAADDDNSSNNFSPITSLIFMIITALFVV